MQNPGSRFYTWHTVFLALRTYRHCCQQWWVKNEDMGPTEEEGLHNLH